MKFSYQWLQSYFKVRLPAPTKLAELLSDHFANVEEVKKQGRDFRLDIEVRPNRASDCFCHWGIAREIAAILKTKWEPHPFRISEDEQSKTADFVKLKIENPKDCRRYTARIVSHVKVGPSPSWLKEKLKTCGLQSINNIVDIANYVMLAAGQPLHAFDFEKIAGQKAPKTIFVRRARAGEKITTLDRKEYRLDFQTLVIADSEKPIGVAGIKGELTTGVDKNSKTILLEAANFNPKTIRKGSKSLALKTDASWRFEHGVDPNLTENTLDRAAFLIQKLARGKVAGGRVDFYPQKVLPGKIILDFKMVKDLLGKEISAVEIVKILTSLGIGFQKISKERISATIPTRRPDLALAEDLVEEIGRILGYHNIPDDPPRVILSPPPENKDIFWEEKARDIFVEAGFSEVWNYSFLSKTAQGAFGLRKEELLELENPLDQNRPYLAPSLLPNLLNNVVLNSSGFEAIKIFELGKVFFRSADQGLAEERRLAAASWGNSRQGFWDLKGGWEFLFEKMGIKDWEWSLSGGREYLRTLKVGVGREELGFLGELRPALAPAPCAKGHLYLSEINFEKLLARASERKTYVPLAKNPEAKRDLSLLVPLKTKASAVKKKIESRKVPYLIRTELFDVYGGQELPNGKKSFAFRFVFRSPEKTLSTREIERSFEEILKMVKTSGWEVRK